jgi:RNA polymerase sporulation-specific sigma factor
MEFISSFKDNISNTSNTDDLDDIEGVDDVDSLEDIDDIDCLEDIDDFDCILKEPRQEPFVEDVLFKIPLIMNPLVGTPKEVQDELDKVVLDFQKDPTGKRSDYEYERILLYMHSYLVNVVLKQFPYIRGMDHSDTYQEALIALRFKAIPNFKAGKGMSFLNFAKMCIRRHLITILNASKNRQRDQSINRAVSLDSQVSPGDDQPNNTFANLIPDDASAVDVETEQKEAIYVTKSSDFEKMVLEEYLTNASYKEIGKNITERVGEDYEQLDLDEKIKRNKAVDNALWRIRKKAAKLKEESTSEVLPLFMKR